jgi:2-C-methyl-D-erythritol 2,4-cyclodiphosphate synthase
VGFGTDLHRLAPGLPLVVGGVAIDSPLGCVAHSDGDVALHALIDALLGATGLGDIGQWFPPSDEQWRGADSAQLLAHVLAELTRRFTGWQLNNVDITVDLERPKLLPYKAAMTARMAELLGVDIGRVNIKAKTAEGQNAVGQGLAIACQCVVLVVLP